MAYHEWVESAEDFSTMPEIAFIFDALMIIPKEKTKGCRNECQVVRLVIRAI